jgi:transposase
MGEAITITRTELTAGGLRAAAAACRDGGTVRRLLALALILDGHSRTEAAKRSGMERQTLRDWVHRYNLDGVVGLKSGHGPGPPPALTAAQIGRAERLGCQRLGCG